MNKTGVASFVLGLISLFLSLYGIFFGIIGFILGLKGLRETDRKQQRGKGLAVAGIATSVIGAGYQIINVVVILITA